MTQFCTLKQLSISSQLYWCPLITFNVFFSSLCCCIRQLFSATFIRSVNFLLQNCCHHYHKLYWCLLITFSFSSLMHWTQLFGATFIFLSIMNFKIVVIIITRFYRCPLVTFSFPFSSICWCIKRNFSRQPCNFNLFVFIILIIQHLTLTLTHTFSPS